MLVEFQLTNADLAQSFGQLTQRLAYLEVPKLNDFVFGDREMRFFVEIRKGFP